MPNRVIELMDDMHLSSQGRCECGNMIDRDFQASINLKAYGERFAS